MTELLGDTWATAFCSGYDDYPEYNNPFDAGTRESIEYDDGFNVADYQTHEKALARSKWGQRAIDILSQMLQYDPEPYIDAGVGGISICYHCAEAVGDEHAPNCTWRMAKELLEEIGNE